MDQIQAGFAKYSPYSYAAQRQEAPGAACKEKHREERITGEREREKSNTEAVQES